MKQWIKSHFWPIYALMRFIVNRNSYFHRSGWVKSVQLGRPSDAVGNPVPWMNYAVIHFLQGRLNKSMKMFEYGSGYSTAFYAKYVEVVYSVEFDKRWYDLVREGVPQNAKVNYVPLDENGFYARAIEIPAELFHIVIVDGRDRFNCFRASIAHLHPAGVVLLDDSYRQDYQPIFKLAKELGFREITLEGLATGDDRFDQTTLFYRDGNCLAI